MTDPFRLEVRNPELETLLGEIGAILKMACEEHSSPGRRYGFALMIFDFGKGGDLFYTSNAQREDMVRLMQEFIEKFREH
jgi:hypothetical protein